MGTAAGVPNFVLCGGNPLVHELAVRLLERYGEGTVTAVVPGPDHEWVGLLRALDRVRVVFAARPDEATLRDAGVAEARALALLDNGDVENFHTALRASEMNPRIRLVIRMFNTGLGFRIRTLFADCVVLSISEMAAPSFIAAALGERAVTYLRLGERTLYVTESETDSVHPVICGIRENPDGVELVGPGEPADRTLALATRVPYSPERRRRWLGVFRYLMRNSLIRLMLVMSCLVALGCCLLVVTGTGWGAAVYETLLDAAGAAGSEPEKSPVFKTLQLAVTFIGLAMTPVVTALVVGGVLRAQLTASARPDPSRYENHVVVAGLGNVGMRIVEQLSDLGVRVVALDHKEDARGTQLARSLGVPVVYGQATWEDSLHAAGVARARALVLATNSDAVNLEAAMLGQSYRDDLRVVIRLSDDDLAERVQRSLRKAVARSVFQLAAPEFAAALVESRVIATLTIERTTLLVAELPVESGSALAGRPMRAATLPGRTRVLAVQRAVGVEPSWQSPPDTVLTPGNHLIAIATRAGLDELQTLCTTSTLPDSGAAGKQPLDLPAESAPPISTAEPGPADPVAAMESPRTGSLPDSVTSVAVMGPASADAAAVRESPRTGLVPESVTSVAPGGTVSADAAVAMESPRAGTLPDSVVPVAVVGSVSADAAAVRESPHTGTLPESIGSSHAQGSELLAVVREPPRTESLAESVEPTTLAGPESVGVVKPAEAQSLLTPPTVAGSSEQADPVV
ncbi:Glutathione-regulated potassium-efflux system protein KefC [Nocardia sp. RB56]|uniref:Glutathione-regulated potassium-efflux system protein KefC n=1 Tax=Nocardia aurantia TaxID=2585199 RepID=A0A7K0DWC6_9NOCA|nr:Glutathione-regulated potassium-efflux system protein KefC [Nocardia aurantia]